MNKLTIYGFEYASSLNAADIQANQHRYRDPLEDIEPALLNKVDIARYVSKTGMVYPFSCDQLKPASYEVNLGKEFLYWDENGQKQHIEDLSDRSTIKIRKNSITYVGVETRFNIPFYIALRFNLTITHVHRGLLLGTGPLVDPGFKGNLMIPIHNLTTNDYDLRPGDPLIAVEFTKVSIDKNLSDDESSPTTSKYLKNLKKPNLTFNDYIENAIKPNKSVESSLEQILGKAVTEVEEANEAIAEVKKESEKTSKIITYAGIFVAAALVIATVAAYFQIQSLVSDANKYVSDSISSTRDRIDDTNQLISDSISSTRDRIDDTNQLISEQKKLIDSLSEKINNLENETKIVGTKNEMKIDKIVETKTDEDDLKK